MEQRVFHGEITTADIAQTLMVAFNRGNYRTQILGDGKKMAIQVATRPGAQSGGQTALTIMLEKIPEGVLVQISKQAWLGIAASLGQTAVSVIRNPFNLLGRLDDLAQDIESLQLTESVWAVIGEAVRVAGAGHQLSEKLRRLSCDYCKTANPVGEANCLACGAPLGEQQPGTCPHCGFVVSRKAVTCPNCRKSIPR